MKRKIAGSTATIVVLSVLLVLSVTTAATLAWFASFDTAGGQFQLGDPVVVAVTDATGSDTEALNMTIASELLLPGMKIVPNIAVTLSPSNTATILRARIDTRVLEGGEGGAVLTDLNQQFRDVLTPVISASWQLNEDDGWYYFLGDADLDARVMNTPAEDSTLDVPEFGSTVADYDDAVSAPRAMAEDVVVASVVSGAVDKTIGFMTQAFRLPSTITNEYANAEIYLDFYVEALQDFLIIDDANVLPIITNTQTIFNEISTYTPAA